MAIKTAASGTSFSRRGFVVLALGLALGQAGRAQEVEQIGPPATASVGAITTEPGGTVAAIGSPTGAGKDVAPVGDGRAVALAAPLLGGSIESTMAGAVIGRLRARTLTPEAAWKSGALDVDTLLYIVGERLGPWGGFFWERDDELRRALVKLLVEHGGEKVKDTSKLPLTVRLWMADYWGNIGDERVLALAESVIADLKPGAAGQEDIALQAVERLAWFYRDRSEYLKGAQSWLRLEPLLSKVGWWQADATIMAAHLYLETPEKQKAGALYLRTAASNDVRLSVAGLGAYLNSLDSEEDYEEAQKQMEQLLGRQVGNVHPKFVAASAMLGYLHYRKGGWATSRKYYEQAIAQSKLLISPQERDSVADVVSRAEAALQEIEQWQKQPIVCEPKSVHIVLGEESQGEPLTKRVYFSTFGSIPLTVSVDSAKCKVSMGRRWSDDDGLRTHQEVILEVAPESLKESFKMVLTTSSARIKNSQVQMPVQIEVTKQQPGGKKE